jgi:hypothetical protein
MDIVTLQILNPQIVGLLHELQNNNLVKLIDTIEYQPNKKVRLSEKYRGAIDKSKGIELLNHIETIRNEWHDTL